jgi:hypothetical protein
MPNLRSRHMVAATPITADTPAPGSAVRGVVGLYINLADNTAAGLTNVDIVMLAAFRLAKVVVIKGGANSVSGNDEVRVQKGATPITETIELGIGNPGVIAARVSGTALLTPAQTKFDIGDTLRIARNIGNLAGTDNAVRIFLYGFAA